MGLIRILPFTAMHKLAIEEKLLGREDSLFVKEKKAFKKTFYTKKSLWYADVLLLLIFNISEYFVKPVLKFLFFVLNIKYCFYHK